MTGLRRQSLRHNAAECFPTTRHRQRIAPGRCQRRLDTRGGPSPRGWCALVIWSCASIEPVLQECAQKRRLLVRQCVASIVEYREGGVRIVFE
jgi:hypothetical protein